jgi:hypothetical protein
MLQGILSKIQEQAKKKKTIDPKGPKASLFFTWTRFSKRVCTREQTTAQGETRFIRVPKLIESQTRNRALTLANPKCHEEKNSAAHRVEVHTVPIFCKLTK